MSITALPTRQIEHHADHLTYQRLNSREWWEGRLEGVNALSMDADGVLARCLVNLPGLRRGEQVALDAVTTALSQLERMGIADARKEALEQAEEEAAQESPDEMDLAKWRDAREGASA